mmetsp:Transcript_4420/g.9558  ORF Transcript_4420/g.9558 Transcript_4420/m.9558 type:complete len:452 (+) Transcript_4420:85-1440(+)|eukprot:CAMPEP_0172571692 /NCGR_PEP_ID=MMETSP1067-20121228/132168_1 /TAXON_ID=265564 ORGANISM="Thalassiosira punctigera, Strain Tpunct2005C2" /NCGR_SAMPLE_ID=MMETSP1067 /ASSEMBLY_ACC=CAM_ASM_000444 /LENGTH=451 /DNA_ID=CAMNT_0013364077 /DNA_START=34 /DNA_END=1389 /DNA_ORIENTATION=-
MDETIGLGFNPQRCGIAGAPTAFVSASLAVGHNLDVDRERSTSTNLISSQNEGIASGGQSGQGIVQTQKQNQPKNGVQQLSTVPPPPPPHPSAAPRMLHRNVPPPFFLPPPPPSSAVQAMPPHSFPPPPSMQAPPPIPNPNSIVPPRRSPLPSFEPPPGLPPVAAVSSLLPPPVHFKPPIPMPPPASIALHSLLPIPSQPTAQQRDDREQQHQQQSSVEKALAIAMKFHHQAVTDKTIPDDIDYAQKRRNHFQKERRKLQEFRLKNLEYVMKHEERELRKHVECMNQVTAYEERQQLQLQFQQQQQRQRRLQMEHTEQQREQRGMMNEGGRGIGTKEQRRAERARKRQRSNPSKKADGGAPSDDRTLRMSLYLTNLPTDGSTTERTLQSLFCLYGRLDRVTMYRHRSTGYLKGDGLVTFGRDAAEEHRTRNGGEGGVDLVDAVCAQVRLSL